MPATLRALPLLLLFLGSITLAQVAAPTAVPPTALKGNDPVSYFTERRPVKGAATIHFDYQEHRYQFASAKNRELFAADPAKYAPQFGGLSPVELSSGKRADADPGAYLVRDGKLYVFSSTQARDYATKNPGLLQRVHESWEKK